MLFILSVLVMFVGGCCFGASANLMFRHLSMKLVYGLAIIYGYTLVLPASAVNTEHYVIWFCVGFVLAVRAHWYDFRTMKEEALEPWA